MHEHLPQHNAKIKSSSNRAFGLVFTAVFLIVALYPLLSGHLIRMWAVFVSGAFLVLALFVPQVLGSLNQLWTKFGALLHRIVSPIALGILFFLVVAPTGWLMRLTGKDPLRLRFDANAKSYWIDRTPPGPDAKSLNNQF